MSQSHADPRSGNELPPALAALRRFAPKRAQIERCDLCSAPLAGEHQHLLEPVTRQLRCSCDACAVLFPGHADARYVRVPRRIERLDKFVLSDEAWAGLHLPIDLAFIFHTGSPQQVVAVYPSPAGGTQAHVDEESWRQLVVDNPVLGKLEADVEALLVNRIGTRREYYRAPIDVCFRLVGLVRTTWRGLSGGTKVWGEIERFFQQLHERTSRAAGAGHA